jgi:hypothetical protein
MLNSLYSSARKAENSMLGALDVSSLKVLICLITVALDGKRARDSAIGLPRRSTSAFRMLVLLMPAEVRRSFINYILSFDLIMHPGP